MFYQAGFAAGQSANAAASRERFPLTHLVAAASVSALLFGSAAYWFAKTGSHGVDTRPLIANNQHGGDVSDRVKIMSTLDSDSATVPGSADVRLIADSDATAKLITPEPKQPVNASSESPFSIPRADLWARLVESSNRDFTTVAEPSTLAVFHSSRWQWVSNDLPFALTGATEPSAGFSSGTSADNTPPAQAGNRLLSSQLLKEIL